MRFLVVLLISLSTASCSLLQSGELKSFRCSEERKDDKGGTAVYQYNKSRDEITWVSVKYSGKEEEEQVKDITASAYKVDDNLIWKFPPEEGAESLLFKEVNYSLNMNTMKMEIRYDGEDKVYEHLLSCKRI